MNPIIILLNGPPRCGKDTIARLAKEEFHGALVHNDSAMIINAEIVKFAEPLRLSMQAFVAPLLLGNARQMTEDMWNKKLEQIKEDQILKFTKETEEGPMPYRVRDAMISMSEYWAKEEFGKDIFGKIAAARMEALCDKQKLNIFFISDSGFESEAQVLIDQFGRENVYQLKLHREGCTFEGDSRSYIDLGLSDTQVATVSNDRDILCLQASITTIIRGLIHDHYQTYQANTASRGDTTEDTDSR